MRRLAPTMALALALAFPVAAAAAPSLLGPTGLMLIPSADTLGMTRWNVSIAGTWADGEPNATIISANVGLLPGLEAGFARAEPEDAEAETLLNAKVRVLQPPVGRITVSAGMIDITDQVDRSAYVVLSHTLGAGVLTRVGPVTLPQIHVGVGGGRLDGLFAGVTTTVGSRIGLMAEYDSEDINLGARIALAANLEGTVAILDGMESVAAQLSFSSPW